jgi:Protein of unknown function (DUF3153)
MNKSTLKTYFKSFFMLPFLCSILVFLTGCVRYDVGVNFPHQHHGEIIQHISLGQRLTSLSQTEATKWLNSIEQRAKLLNGTTKHISEREIIVAVPFSNGQELEEKFNQFFDPSSSFKVKNSSNLDDLKLLQLDSKLTVTEQDWFFLAQNNLKLTVDLRALGVLSEQGNIIVSPGSLVDIDFDLNTPFGGQSIDNESALNPTVEKIDNQLVWHLKAGEINTIQAVFWVPNYLGIGTIVIILLATLGYYLKYKRLPGAPQSTLI